jgi:hypothetical protein
MILSFKALLKLIRVYARNVFTKLIHFFNFHQFQSAPLFPIKRLVWGPVRKIKCIGNGLFMPRKVETLKVHCSEVEIVSCNFVKEKKTPPSVKKHKKPLSLPRKVKTLNCENSELLLFRGGIVSCNFVK